MKRFSSLFLFFIPLILFSQEDTSSKGIHWTTGLSWEQVKQKARQENKYIFIDCFTTWCGPCKMLDKTVFSNDTVGSFFNEHFISVKMQMDKTSADDKYVQAWYGDASALATEYVINAYPTAIFFSPNGVIVHKDGGFRPVQDFISMAKLALTPGKVYENPYAEYKRLVNEYNQGIKHYNRMAEMVKISFEQNNSDFAKELLKDHLNYASTLNEKERYTKENIEVWASFILKFDNKALQYFLKDEDKIDKVMNQKGYSRDVVDKIIQVRIVDSFFRMQKGVTTTINGMKIPNSEIMFVKVPVRRDGKIEPDLVEADWKKLKTMILEHFSEKYVIRNVLSAKVRWYWQHENMEGVAKAYFSRLAKYPPADFIKEFTMTNEICWQTFLYSNDKRLLKDALEWMKKIIQEGDNEVGHLDTYANLLYKLGRTNEAILWEEKAARSESPKVFINRFGEKQPNQYIPVLEQMKKGEPTYLEEGAIWPNKK